MSIKEYKQSTYETCLPSCLISLCDSPANEENELEIWRHGWKFDRYVVGQLEFVAKKFGKKFRLYVEHPEYAKLLSGFQVEGVEIINQKVDLKLIKKRLENRPAIIYLDDFALHGLNHVPHFVIITGINNKTATIMDPYEGKFVEYDEKAIQKGMNLLWNHILNTRMLIELV